MCFQVSRNGHKTLRDRLRLARVPPASGDRGLWTVPAAPALQEKPEALKGLRSQQVLGVSK